MPTKRSKKTEFIKPGVSAEIAVVPSDLEIVDCKMVPGERLWYLDGRVRNNSTRTFHSVKVQFNLYDAYGALLRKAFDYMNNFEPGTVWRFEAYTGYLTSGAAPNWKLTELKGSRSDSWWQINYLAGAELEK